MSAQPRRRFRIEEQIMPGQNNVYGEDLAEKRHKEIMDAIAVLKSSSLHPDEIADITNSHHSSYDDITADIIEAYRHDLMEVARMKGDLERIYNAIYKTKKEIKSLQQSGVEGMNMGHVSGELDAIVNGTERATENILAAAEDIEQKAGDLAAIITDEAHNSMACDIQEQTIKIFEACNFQDITGQRVTKIVTTFKYIEERIREMVEIWGGVSSFDDIDVPEIKEEWDDENPPLHGPSGVNSGGDISQDDIDALFS
jgi:chemotaxis protein CheZ